jgi:hypothetical protein
MPGGIGGPQSIAKSGINARIYLPFLFQFKRGETKEQTTLCLTFHPTVIDTTDINLMDTIS